jgi:hypothetical protein
MIEIDRGSTGSLSVENWSVGPHVSARLPLDKFPWNLVLGELLWKSVNKIPVSLKLSKTSGICCCGRHSVVIKTLTSNEMGLTLSRQARMYKGHANAPQCHVVCRAWHLSVLFKTGSRNAHICTICLQIAACVNIWSNKKCTLVQALRLCTGRTAHRGSRYIALLFLDHGTGRC